MQDALDVSRNQLLQDLPPETLARLVARMRPVRIARLDQLVEAYTPIRAAYFPTSGVYALVIRFEDGFQAEVGLVGAEGVIGLSLSNGAAWASVDVVAQIGGEALRIEAPDFAAELARSPDLALRMRRFGERLRAQAMQMVACNGHHALEQRLARWLLMVHDRVGGRELALTQDVLASMLCAHRPSVSVAAGRLQRSGAICYGHGKVTILDRALLQRSACECYAALQQRIQVNPA